MGSHLGAAPEPPSRPPVARDRLLKLALGLTATLIAWGYLVVAAIDFGGQARDGEGTAWIFLVVATLGATACLFAFLVLVPKVTATLRGELPPKLTTTPGKRAKR